MAEGEQKPESESSDEHASVDAPKPRRLVPILLAVNTAAIVAVLALQVIPLVRPVPPNHAARGEDHGGAAERHEPVEAAAHKDVQPGPTLRLADFVVHLRDPDADRYARVSFEMELPDEKAKEAATARMPQIRDAFLAYLSDRSTDELRGSEAIGRIKSALAQKASDLAPSARLRGLYVTELVVQ